MPTTPVSSVLSTPAAATSATDNVFKSMGSDAFLKLLVAQMRYQNPMSPSDPTAMMGQIATYAQVEALNKIQASQAGDQMMNAARMATEMVGKTVTATDGETTEVGRVTAARFTADGPVLVLENGTELTLAAVISVTDTPATPSTTPLTPPVTTTTPTTTPASTTPATTTPASTTPTTTTGTTPASTTGTTPTTPAATGTEGTSTS